MADIHTQRQSSLRPSPPRAVCAALAVLVFAALFVSPGAARADELSDAGYFAGILNDFRVANGVQPLAVADDLTAVAQGWAQQLASYGYLAHNPSLASSVDNWWELGENVAQGWLMGGWAIHLAWVSSPGHYANMVRPEFNAVGVGVAYDGYGRLYVVEDFAAR